WVTMESLKYNHLNPRQKQWYGKPLRLYGDDGKLLCSDTIRCWFDWPHYKTYIPSDEEMLPTSTNLRGGAGDWYCFRLAETYLLRAEAKFYLGDPTATDDVNAVRQRAHCQQLYSTVTIDDIMDERARELYMEEWRHMELSRVSYCLALSGKPDKWGNTYNVNQLAEKSLWFERITRYNNYYNKNIVEVKDQHYTLAAHNIYWPIPQNKAINANRDGQLMQNPGYDGYDPNVPVWDNWEDAVADEYSN
ncbi:RagB/SusD family nutrient uptake outer membrane protein, partial [Paraprevotella clara]